MIFKYNREQYNALAGLAYRIADNTYMKERYERDEITHEIKSNRKTITMLFDELDKMCVPYWVQNTVICFAEDWRRYKRDGMKEYLKNKNIMEAIE